MRKECGKCRNFVLDSPKTKRGLCTVCDTYVYVDSYAKECSSYLSEDDAITDDCTFREAVR